MLKKLEMALKAVNGAIDRRIVYIGSFYSKSWGNKVAGTNFYSKLKIERRGLMTNLPFYRPEHSLVNIFRCSF